MEFMDLRIKNINYIINFNTNSMGWLSKNRDYHIIGLKLDGAAMHYFENRKFNLCKNCIFFFNQSEDYKVEVLEKGETLAIHFTTYEPIETDSFCIKLSDTTEILALIEKLRTNYSRTLCTDSTTLSSFYKLCARFEDIRQREYSQTDARLIKAKEYINLNFTKKDCLKLAAESCGISRRRFNELFKLLFNITPNRYITTRKIELSKQLLFSNQLSVTEISEICGFGDIYYFSKVFTAETGVSPLKYRSNAML